jgi:hypothetical protein
MPAADWPSLLEGLDITDISPAAAEAAASRVREYCGWHLAPAYTDTVEVEGPGFWRLNTRKIISVASVTDVVTAQLLPVSDYYIEGGHIVAKWSRYRRRVSIVFTHGYSKCPGDVVLFVRELANAGAGEVAPVSQETVGQTNVSYREPNFSVLDQYALPRIA